MQHETLNTMKIEIFILHVNIEPSEVSWWLILPTWSCRLKFKIKILMI